MRYNMENKNTIIEKIDLLKAEQTELEIFKRDFDKICNEKKRASYACYEKCFSEAKSCLEKTPQIIKPISDKFTSVLSKSGGALCLNGKNVPSVSFDYTNCFDVFKKAQSVFVANAKAILTNLSVLQLSEQTMKMLYQLCSSHNTIFDFNNSKNELIQAQWNDEYQALCSEKDSASKKIEGIKNQIIILEFELQNRVEKVNRMKSELCFHHGNKAESSFVSNITIPLGYASDKDGQIESICEWNPTQNNILRIVVPKGMEKDDGLSSLLKNIVLNFYNSYPVGAFRTLICDEYQFLGLDNLLL